MLPADLPALPSRIVAGGNHTLLLFNDGTVLCSGFIHDRMVQSGSLSDFTVTFQKTCTSTIGNKIKACSAFWSGSIFVDSEYEVFAVGTGLKGELGTPGISTSVGFHMVPHFPPVSPTPVILDIASGIDHTVVVLETGEVYGWGNGRKGQLGYPNEVVWTPRKFANVDFKVVRAVCGRGFTYLVGEPSIGPHAILGSNKWGVQSQAPAAIPDWADIGASWGSIFVLDAAGKISSWGRNDRGQLAPHGLPYVEKLAVGSEHAIALTKNEKIICWGWGEHGNCGATIDEDGDVKGKWNEIPLDQSDHSGEIIGVGAGCATSFYWTK